MNRPSKSLVKSPKTELHADQADDQQEQDDVAEGEEEPAEDADQADDLADVICCLTVTARRLQGLTLGRKFSGNTKSIAQRKAESCAVCGQKGHWQGDSGCPQSGSNASSSGSKGKLLQPGRRNLMRKAVRAKRSWSWVMMVASAW